MINKLELLIVFGKSSLIIILHGKTAICQSVKINFQIIIFSLKFKIRLYCHLYTKTLHDGNTSSYTA